MTLAEIIEEGERLEREALAIAGHDSAGYIPWQGREDFYKEHGPTLLAVAKAAVEWGEAEADNAAPHPDEVCLMGPGDCEPCMAIERRYQRVRAAHDALFAAVRGDAAIGEGR